MDSPIAIGWVGERAGASLQLAPRHRQGSPGCPIEVLPISDEGLELLRVEADMDLAAAEPLCEVRDLQPDRREVARRFLPKVDALPGRKPGRPEREAGQVVQEVAVQRAAPVEHGRDT